VGDRDQTDGDAQHAGGVRIGRREPKTVPAAAERVDQIAEVAFR
jgi:hypothetical protein